MHGQGGQATVEWVALVLLAALVLGAGAALAAPENERDLGRLVAERITRTSSGVERGAATGVAPAGSSVAPAVGGVAPAPQVPGRGASAPPAPGRRARSPGTRRAVDAFRRLRGVRHVARHAWIVCLGYRRWRYELEHPSAPMEALPLREALAIANDCLNPYGYLFEK